MSQDFWNNNEFETQSIFEKVMEKDRKNSSEKHSDTSSSEEGDDTKRWKGLTNKGFENFSEFVKIQREASIRWMKTKDEEKESQNNYWWQQSLNFQLKKRTKNEKPLFIVCNPQ